MAPRTYLHGYGWVNLTEPENVQRAVRVIGVSGVFHILGKINRFAGNTEPAYSVAMHSMRCAHLVYCYAPLPSHLRAWGAILALLHDAHEIFTGDVTGPCKNPDLVRLQDRIQDGTYVGLVPVEARYKAAGFGSDEARHQSAGAVESMLYAWKSVVSADAQLLRMEMAELMKEPGCPCPLQQAYENGYLEPVELWMGEEDKPVWWEHYDWWKQAPSMFNFLIEEIYKS